MKNLTSLAFFIALLVSLPPSASAQVRCAGLVTQANLMEDIKSINQSIQKDILDFRKKEAELKKLEEGSDEAAALKAEINKLQTKLQQDKGKFKTLNAPNLPTTSFTVYGAACSDNSWVDSAKSALVKNPEELGKEWFVWKDVSSKEFAVSKQAPQMDRVIQ